MNVLVACEESQEVTAAFIALGHNAMSCDLQPGAKGLPHYQGDMFDLDFSKFDLVIAHPPCTYIANSGNRWHAGTLARWHANKPLILFGGFGVFRLRVLRLKIRLGK
jgi:hypothetical protein